jgi:hypothetical protein
MIDEKELGAQLTKAAAWQDDLLPRALADDLLAGRRRLRRRRALTVLGSAGTAAVVGAITVGMVGWLSPAAGPVDGNPPVANTATAPSTSTKPITQAGLAAARQAQDRAFDRALRGALEQHLDPVRKHLDYSSNGGATLYHDPGLRRGSLRGGWRIAGQKGMGYASVGVAASMATVSHRCGSPVFTPRLTCRTVTLPNGRPALLGRRGEAVEITYVKPNGEFVSATVNPLFANNTSTPVHDMGITDAMLFALVTDPRLTLPPRSAEELIVENELKAFKPTQAEVHAAAARILTGGTTKQEYSDTVPEQFGLHETWRSGAVQQLVMIAVDSAYFVSKCSDQLGGLTCTVTTTPDGRKVMYAEGVPPQGRGKQRYMMGAAYLQPDGNLASVVVQNPGKQPQPAGITKAQVIALVTDSALDK